MSTLRLALAALLLAPALAACCQRPWKAFPMETPPDRACMMGTTHGHTLWIWDCVDGEKVVVGQYTAEMSCAAPELEKAACGEFTPLEVEYGLDQPDAACEGAPEWQTD